MIQLIKTYSNVTKILSSLGLLVAAVLLVGCSRSPTVSTAQTALKVDVELAKIELIKTSMQTARASLYDYRVSDTEPALPEPLHLISLKSFLEENNCKLYFGVTADFNKANECYRATVIRLINETNYVDVLGTKLYRADVKNYQYWTTLNALFDSLGVPPVEPLVGPVAPSDAKAK